MKKYLLVAKNTWDEILVYRLNFILWRMRVILQLLTVYFLWESILPQGSSLFGYNQRLMLTYILGTSFMYSMVLTSRSYAVGADINNGNLSNFLIRPINYFFYWFAKDLGDKAMNILFSIFELTVFIILLQPSLFFQTNSLYMLFTIIASLLSFIMYFFLNFLLGAIGFWSPEVWAPRFIFSIVISFFAGGMFPLDILPKPVATFFQFLPFQYLLYFPIKIYLGQLSVLSICIGLCISALWVMIFYKVLQIIWKKGLILYTAEGK
ncbi:MAG: ABC transporter permease [Candidatus Levyibacteriota bacterium]